MSTQAQLWESIFRSRDWGRYPQEEVVRFVMRHYRDADRANTRILEIGCGPGSGASWFVAREGFQLYGLDFSPIAIAKARERFAHEGLAGEFVVASACDIPWPADTFDAVLEVGCLACLTEDEAERAVRSVYSALKPGGRFLSTLVPIAGTVGDDPAADRVDSTTLRSVAAGPYAGLGAIRFPSRSDVVHLYDRAAPYSAVAIDEVRRTIGGGEQETGYFVVEARK